MAPTWAHKTEGTLVVETPPDLSTDLHRKDAGHTTTSSHNPVRPHISSGPKWPNPTPSDLQKKTEHVKRSILALTLEVIRGRCRERG